MGELGCHWQRGWPVVTESDLDGKWTSREDAGRGLEK